MNCVRCGNPLSARADRCLRCFALNPSDPGSTITEPAPARGQLDHPAPSDPAWAKGAIEVDVPVETPSPPRRPPAPAAPVRAPPAGSDPAAAVPVFALPEPSLPAVSEPGLSGPPSAPPADVPLSPFPRTATPMKPVRQFQAAAPTAKVTTAARKSAQPASLPHPGELLLAWGVDALVLLAALSTLVLLAAWLVRRAGLSPAGAGFDVWVDLLAARALLPAWAVLLGALALGYSALFAALGGRTPGLTVARLQLTAEQGGPLRPREALLRAAAAVLLLPLGAFGFAWAFVDPLRRTLHDRLAHARVVRG